MPTIEFTLNGEARSGEARPDESLLDVLRNRLGVTSPKDGCAPQGQCGCCLALVDGRPKVACVYKAAKVDGGSVLTLEGVPDAERETFSRAFVKAAGLQCGFCIPGIVLRAKHLLDKNAEPSRAEIAKAIDGHLCRCTGYVRIIDAIELAARALRTGEPIELEEDGGVGDNLERYQGRELTLGARDYVADISVPDLLHGAVVLSEHARARVVSIDTSVAAAHPGVSAVVTAADVPGERWYGLIYPDWPGFVAVGEETRCVGDFVAAVAAVDEHTAREAAALVRVTYEPLPAATTPEAAMADGAHQVNPTKPNVMSATCFSRGGGRGPGGERARGGGHLRHPAHRAPLPRARERPDGAALRRHAAPLHPGAGRLRRSPAGRGLPGARRGAGLLRARPQRGRLRRQGGPEHPGALGAVGPRHGAPRPGDAQP